VNSVRFDALAVCPRGCVVPGLVHVAVVILLINIPARLVRRSRGTAYVPRERYYFQRNISLGAVLREICIYSPGFTQENLLPTIYFVPCLYSECLPRA
jgi:hypothetical protein